MRKTWNFMMAAVICAGLQAGCGGGDEETSSAPLGPKEVALAMLRAMIEGDGVTAVKYYHCSAEDKEYMIKTMPLLGTFKNVARAGTKAYGAETWEAARDKAKLGMLTVPDMNTAENDIQCTITGRIAVCKLEGIASWNLVKRGDTWLIIPHPTQLPLLDIRGDLLAASRKTKIAVDAIIPRIGAKNVSADDICAKIKKAIGR
jgi:hypothetical protein